MIQKNLFLFQAIADRFTVYRKVGILNWFACDVAYVFLNRCRE